MMRWLIAILFIALLVAIPVSADYALQVQALTNSPTDGATTYISGIPTTPYSTANLTVIVIPEDGILHTAEIYDYSGTAGTAESWYYYSDVRNGATSDELITNFTVSANSRQAWNTSLNQVATIVDKFTFKRVNPKWATNPLTNLLYGYSYVDVDSSLDSPRGYPLFVEAISYNPSDGQTTYFGNRLPILMPLAPRIMPWWTNFWNGSGTGHKPLSYRNLVHMREYSRCPTACSGPPI